jgi:alpha-1,2-mannosyltransferase
LSGATIRSAADQAREGEPPEAPQQRRWNLTPTVMVITAATLLAFLLRLHQLLAPGILYGADWYDDGVFFASALRLVHGVIPYRDFIFAQPPGVTLLMSPAALLANVIGTAKAMGVARALTMLASTAAVPLAGLLVRHRGLFAVIVTSGLLAVFPTSVLTAHTIYVETWLVLFCLAGALAIFDGDGLARGRRLIWGGVLFGCAGAIETWAIMPVVVIIALSLRRPGLRAGTARFMAGLVASVSILVLPFFLLDPVRFYQSVVTAQLARVNAARTPVLKRLWMMTGLIHVPNPTDLLIVTTAVLIVAFIVVTLVCAFLVTRRPPPPLEVFVLVTGTLVVAAFMLPPGFFFHFPTFLAPFLAMSIALPTSRLLAALRPLSPRFRTDQWLRWTATGLAVLALVAFTVIQVRADARRSQPKLSHSSLVAFRRLIPRGDCVFTDQVSFLIAANRFFSIVPGCTQMIDPYGTDLALSNGRDGLSGAGRVPAVAAIFRSAFDHAQFVWLSGHYNLHRIAWTPQLRAYFYANFVKLRRGSNGTTLWERKSLLSRAPHYRR